MSTAGLTEELRLVEEDLTRLQKTAADLRRPKPAILAVIGPDGAVHAGPDALRCLAGIVGPAALSWRTAPALAYGVKAVANDLTVTPPVSPEKVQAVIEDAFRREAEVDARHIRVEVSDHTAKLYGHVHSVHEAAAARAAAAAARWWPRWRATCWSLRNRAGWSRRSSVTPVPASQRRRIARRSSSTSPPHTPCAPMPNACRSESSRQSGRTGQRAQTAMACVA